MLLHAFVPDTGAQSKPWIYIYFAVYHSTHPNVLHSGHFKHAVQALLSLHRIGYFGSCCRKYHILLKRAS